MDDKKLGFVESKFADIIWQHEPISSGELVKRCEAELHWKKPTTYTILRKMCEKGFAANNDTIVTSLVPKEDVQSFASEHFVDHTFHGSLPKFLVSFFGEKKLSKEEAEELKNLIDQHKEG